MPGIPEPIITTAFCILEYVWINIIPWGPTKTFTVVWSAIAARSRALELFVGYGGLLVWTNLRFKQIFKNLSFGWEPSHTPNRDNFDSIPSCFCHERLCMVTLTLTVFCFSNISKVLFLFSDGRYISRGQSGNNALEFRTSLRFTIAGNAWGATRIQRELKRVYGEHVSRPTVGSVLVGPTWTVLGFTFLYTVVHDKSN